MRLHPNHKATDARPARARERLRAIIVAGAIIAVSATVGFGGFLAQLSGAEVEPAARADGIVVLTGGSSRVSDAMELLADGYGKRVLISRVHPTNSPSDILRSLPHNQSLLLFCLDLHPAALHTPRNPPPTPRWGRERGL